MRAEVIDAHARVLSVAPFFDSSTAADIVSTFAGDVVSGADKVAASFSELRLSGLLEKEGVSWRIAEPARQDYLEEMKTDHVETYRGAVGLFLTHATNGFGPSLAATVGDRGADLLIRVMRLAVADSPDAAFAEVIEQVQAGGRSGRESDARIAQHVIRDLPGYRERDRHLALLLGLELWRAEHHAEARQHFERVLKEQSSDLASAIAAHLLAVSWREVGEDERASAYVTEAVGTLRSLGDRRGLRMALTTLGGVERELFSRLLARADDSNLGAPERSNLLDEAQVHFDAAQDALDEAIGIGDDLADKSGAGAAKLELASCFQRWGEVWTALEVAEDARESLDPQDSDYLRALTLLASLYRDVGDIPRAGDAL